MSCPSYTRLRWLANPCVGLTLVAVLAGCNASGEAERVPQFTDIGRAETIQLTGTEPFWGGSISGDQFRYRTIDDQDGVDIAVDRFTGNSGLGFSGELEGEPIDLTITRGACSDGMSDRRYPFHATLKTGAEVRQGCAWTDQRPFEGPEAP